MTGSHLAAAATVALAVSMVASTGCYAEREPPTTYRYPCSTNADCDDVEACRGGICERLCSVATFEDDCGASINFATCFNGACASVCEIGADECPSEQECVDLSEFGVDLSGAGSPFIVGGGGDGPLGVCGRKCEDDTLCGAGESCFEGFCVEACEPGASSCADGFVCAPPGVCAPESPAEGGLGGGRSVLAPR